MKGIVCLLAVTVSILFPFKSALSQNPLLLKDINPKGSSAPSNMIRLSNGKFLFTADDSKNVSFWITDGTPAGTQNLTLPYDHEYTIKDVYRVNEHLILFTVLNNDHSEFSLWKTGDSASEFQFIEDLKNLNIIFIGSDGEDVIFYSGSLYETDGTASGTKLLLDVSGKDATSFTQAQIVRGVMTFILSQKDSDFLYAVDQSGIHKLKQFYGHNEFVSPWNFLSWNDWLYFPANDSATGSHLWRSDGTAAGTIAVDSLSEMELSFPGNKILPYNGLLFYSTGDSDDVELRAYNMQNNEAGVVVQHPGVQLLDTAGHNLYFLSKSGANFILWKTDGTESGDTSLAVFENYINPNPYVHDGILYFQEMLPSSKGSFYNLWKTDGSASGTKLLKVNSDKSDFVPTFSQFSPVNENLYFVVQYQGASSLDVITAGADTVHEFDFFHEKNDNPVILQTDSVYLYLSLHGPNSKDEPYIFNTAEDIVSGVPVLQDDDHILLAPNPAHTTLFVEDLPASGAWVTVVNMLGKEMQIMKTTSRFSTVDVHTLETGIYLLMIRDQDGKLMSVSKFMKE